MRSAFLIVGVLFLVSCDPDMEKMTVIKDCTGVYIRSSSGTDYKVCNEEDLSGYSNGETIKVKFETLEMCFGLIEPPSCSEVHPFSSNVEVIEIK